MYKKLDCGNYENAKRIYYAYKDFGHRLGYSGPFLMFGTEQDYVWFVTLPFWEMIKTAEAVILPERKARVNGTI